jgi:beta-lactamase regulating signal transducer with metallopeptidase domain
MSALDLWFWGFVDVAIVSLLVLAGGAFIAGRLKQPVERLRTIQWTLAAVVVALLARESALLPQWSLPWLPAQKTIATTTTDSTAPADTALRSSTAGDTSISGAPSLIMPAHRRSADEGAARPQPASQPASSISIDWRVLLQFLCIAIAAAGATWFVALWAVGRWQLTRLLASSQSVETALLEEWPHWPSARSSGIQVLASTQACLPMTFGVWRPVIVLPAQLIESADRRQLHYCLSHEWAHIRSGDNVTWWFVRMLQPLLWFQPLFWRLRRELRLCQDQLADHFAAHGAHNRVDYAELLLSLARRQTRWHSVPALTMAGRPSSIRRRVELLLTDGFSLATSMRRSVAWMLAACMVGAVTALAAVQLERAAANDGDVPTSVAANNVHGSPQNQPLTQPSASPAADAESLAFSGTVIDKESQKPIEGAKVVVRREIIRVPERRIIEESEHITDSSGNYHFVIPPEQVAERRLYIELDVEHPDYAWKKGFGYALSMIRKNLPLGEPPFFSRIELYPAEPITGRVVDPNGQPLPGVKLLAYSKADVKDWQDYGSFFRTETDSDGRFHISAVKGGPCVAWIVPEDFAPVQLVLGTKKGDQGDIRVERGVSLSGQVLSATGEPVAGVWVNLEDDASQAEIQMPVASAMERSALTDENGQFQLGPMKPALCELYIDNYPGEIKYHSQVRNPAELQHIFSRRKFNLATDDENRPITIQAVPHVEFRGQYVDSKGQPNPGHDISIFGQLDGQWFHQQLHPDNNGKIVGRLPHGLEKARLEAITNEHSALHVRLKKDGPLVNPRDVELGTIEDDVTGIEIIRYKAPIVQITVVDEQGAKIDGAKVAGAYSNDYELMSPVDGLPTHIFFEKQPDGRFRTSQMLPDTEIVFKAEAEGYEGASETLSLPEETEKEITLRLKKKTVEPAGDQQQ